MSPLSGSSSSEDEDKLDQPISELVQPLSAAVTTSTPTAESIAIQPKRSADIKPDLANRMLKLIMQIVRKTPTDDAEKGISVQKIKQQLGTLEYKVRKAEISKHLRPALETAIKRKWLLKTTGQKSVLIGSVRINPAYLQLIKQNTADGSEEQSGSSDEEPETGEIPVVVVESKKRKAVKDSDEMEGIRKRRK